MREWLRRIDHVPLRYALWLACVLGALLSGLGWALGGPGAAPLALLGGLSLLGLRDRLQTRRSVLRNYPVAGHLRFLLEYDPARDPPVLHRERQRGRPFSRQQRSMVYQRAKGDSDKRPFGTQLRRLCARLRVDQPLDRADAGCRTHDFRVTIGGPDCTQPYSACIFNISAMSFGALSANAILRPERRREARPLRARHRRRLDQPATTASTAAT